MIKALHLLKVLFFVFCFCERVAAETFWAHSDPLAMPSETEPHSVSLSALPEPIPASFKQPAGNSLSLDLGPSIIKLKTFYLEKREENDPLAHSSNDSNLQRYLNVLATSSYFDGQLIGEGEFAYGTMGLAATAGEQPRMFRAGLKGRWKGLSYGADYRSIGTGFVSLFGDRIDHDRDEGQIWAERSFGSLRIRGSLGELWQTKPSTTEFTFTKTAATSFSLSKSNWSALLSSSYSLIDSGTNVDERTGAFTNDLSVSYRPTTILTIVPKLSVTDEWDQTTGLRTDTPAAAVTLLWGPAHDIQLTGLASYARGMSEDGLKDSSTVNTGAGLQWKIGKSRFGEQSLSFRLEYNHKVSFHSANDSPAKLYAMVSFKIVGF